MTTDFFFGYEYEPCPDAEERLAQTWDIIFALILEDYLEEQEALQAQDDVA